MPWSVAFMVVAIVLIASIAKVARERNRAMLGDPASADWAGAQGETARLREETKALRERIQVLERVVTEDRKSIDLDREIAALRDR